MRNLILFFVVVALFLASQCSAQDLSLSGPKEETQSLTAGDRAIVNAIMSGSAMQVDAISGLKDEVSSLKSEVKSQGEKIDEILALVREISRRPAVEPIPDPEPMKEPAKVVRSVARTIESESCYLNSAGVMVCPAPTRTASNYSGTSGPVQRFLQAVRRGR